MPYDDPDASDPMALRGVMLETDSADANREMAACFIEEYARMGFNRERLLKMFMTPDYAGPFMAYRELGEAEIIKLIDDQVRLRGPRSSTHDRAENTERGISLPILDS